MFSRFLATCAYCARSSQANPSQLCGNNDTRIAAADLYTLSPKLVRDIVWDFLDFDLIQRSSWTKIAGSKVEFP